MTATTENAAPFGFQHLVQPQAWLNATLPLRATVTGWEVHLQVSVPPAKSLLPALIPLSIDGCSERAIGFSPLLIGKKRPAALFSDCAFVAGGKKRGFCRLRYPVTTPGRP